MKAKVKTGHELLFMNGKSNNWNPIKDYMVINFNSRWTFTEFKQKRNHLVIETTDGDIDIVFTGETPKLTFSHYEKDQLVLKVA